MICGNKFVSPLGALQTIFIKNIYIYTKQLKYKEITISYLSQLVGKFKWNFLCPVRIHDLWVKETKQWTLADE